MNELLAHFAKWTRRPSFSEWLPDFLSQPCLRELRPKLDVIVPAKMTDRTSFVTQFEKRVCEACYGAFISALRPDWRSEVRARNKRFKQRAPSMVKAVLAFRDFLQDYPDHMMFLVGGLEHSLEPKYGDRADFSSLQEDRFLFDALSEVANQLEHIAATGLFDSMDRKYGPIDFGKPVRGKKVRSMEQMLAFHLEFLLRQGSIGVATKGCPMPGKGQPHRGLVASLVDATLGADNPITAEWVADSIKSILRDNPNARIEGWPGTGEEPFIWYSLDPSWRDGLYNP